MWPKDPRFIELILLDDPRDLGLEGTSVGSNRFIVACWRTPFGSILRGLLKMKSIVFWPWKGVWLSFSRLNEEGTFGVDG